MRTPPVYDGPVTTLLPQTVALARSSHPGPTLAVTLLTVLLGIGVGASGSELVLLGAAMLLGQVSVGLSNDWLDAERDAINHRVDKPIASGELSAVRARNVAIACVVGAVLLGIPLGLPFSLAHAVFIASAWGYNLGLKSTPLSFAPYALSFGLLPTLAVFARDESTLVVAPWAIAAGALIGSAAHFANVLPDLDDDARTGIRGLPHLLGARGSGVAAFALLIAAGLVVALAPAGDPTTLQWAGLAATLAISTLGLVLVVLRRAQRLMFGVIIATALLTVVLLLVSGERMLA